MSMVVIPIRGDGSCFFHAIESALGTDKNLRALIFSKLDCVIPETGKTYFQTYHSEEPEIKEQYKTKPADSRMFGLVSRVLNINIFVLLREGKKLILYPYQAYYKNEDIALIPQRPCVVLFFYLHGHFDLVGYKEDSTVKTLFSYNHPFIQEILSKKG